MKYIRTKDGRIAEVKDNMFIKETTIEIINQKGLRLVYKDRPDSCVLNGSGDYIVKQADNIGELCDEFVVVHNTEFYNGKDIYYLGCSKAHLRGDCYYDFTFEQMKTGRINIGGTLYGAIWTDKGLIYVAKMNDKGELELL